MPDEDSQEEKTREFRLMGIDPPDLLTQATALLTYQEIRSA